MTSDVTSTLTASGLPASGDAATTCPHCQAPVEGAQDRYCCVGCALAAEIMQNAGIATAQETITALPSRPQHLDGDWSAVPTTAVGPWQEAHLVVDGIRCTSCTWVVEQVLGATAGVELAQVSYATGRATVRFDPAKITLHGVAQRVAAIGYRPRPVDTTPTLDRDLLTRLGVAAFASANVMLLSASRYAGWWSGMEDRFTVLFQWGSLALATPVALWSAEPFLAGAWRGLRAKAIGMDVPIAIAVVTLYVHGVVSTLQGVDAYLDSLGMLVTLLLTGRLIEARGRRHGAEAATALAAALPTRARRLTASGVAQVSADELRPGDVVIVGLGDEVPADGVVASGTSEVRMALLTGEADPVAVGPGDAVVAGAGVVAGSITVTVERAGEDTLGHRMARQVASAAGRGLTRTPADRLAPAFTLLAVAFAGGGAALWTATDGLAVGLPVGVAVLVVACPCALGLSWPLAAAAGLGALGRRGVILRSGDALLRLADVDRVAIDKTGTVTQGIPQVSHADDSTLRIAAALEAASQHPIARAVLDAAQRRGLPFPIATNIEELPGQGISGVVDGVRYALRSGRANQVQLAHDGRVVGTITLRDVPRDDAKAVISALRQRGAPVTLLTGDHRDVADAIARDVGIDAVLAHQRPNDKARWLREQRDAGHHVLFVGDGLNDGPALAVAHASLAMREGATASLLAADGVLAEGHLSGLTAALRAGQAVRATVHLTLAWSLGYNVLAVGLALAGWVNPLVAAVLMPLSSLVVVALSRGVERRMRRQEARAHQELAWT